MTAELNQYFNEEMKCLHACVIDAAAISLKKVMLIAAHYRRNRFIGDDAILPNAALR